MSIVEETREGRDHDDKVLVAFISIVPSSGDLVYDEFEGLSLRPSRICTNVISV